MGYQCLSDSGGELQCPPEGSGFRLMPTLPYSLTHFSSSGMQVRGSTPGDCGRILDAGDLLVAPCFQRLGRRRVVAVAIDDEAHGGLFPGIRMRGSLTRAPCRGAAWLRPLPAKP